jgi:hypothetical protein
VTQRGIQQNAIAIADFARIIRTCNILMLNSLAGEITGVLLHDSLGQQTLEADWQSSVSVRRVSSRTSREQDGDGQGA